mgnify:CR=1 FL=1
MGTDCKSAAFQLRWFESTRAHQTRKIRTCFRLEKGSDFSFSSGLKMKAPVDDAKLRYLVIDRKPLTRFGGYDYEVRCKGLPFQHGYRVRGTATPGWEKISIDGTGVEDALDVTMAQQTELDYLIYNDPLGYADLILNGDPEEYLKNVAGSHRLED